MLNPDRVPAAGFPQPAPHLSEQARRYFLHAFSRAQRDTQDLPSSRDPRAWQKRNEQELRAREIGNSALLAHYGARLHAIEMGGVPVTDIRPARGALPGKALVYVHGGGFVGGTAADALDSTLPLAEQTGLRILSVDYTTAPTADHVRIAEQVLRVLAALYEQGHQPSDVGVYADSAGGSIALSALLCARASGLILPAALALWSPWADLTCSGDSYRTLADAEPFYVKERFLDVVARCYAGDSDLADPRVSVLFADYASGFMPTLIQCGTRELLLSDAIRLHQRMRDAGVDAELELYDGLWHVFQFKPIDSPEAIRARDRTGRFLLRHLGVA